MNFRVENETKYAKDVEVGDIVIHYDKAYRVLNMWHSDSYEGRITTLDLKGNGDEYERFSDYDEVPVLRMWAEL